MSKKDELVFIKHIIESIEKVEEYSQGLKKAKLKEDTKIQDAIVRRIEIIGEASKNLSSDFKNKHPEIKWKEIIGTRDKVVHHYFGVDLMIIWDIIKNDLPKLKKDVKTILNDIN